MKKDREKRRCKTWKRRGPAGRRRRRVGRQGRTVNFRYGTPRKAGSGRRDKKASPQVAAPEDDSFLLPSFCPTPPLSLRLPFGQERPGKLCEARRRLSSSTKVSLKIRETLRSATLKRKGTRLERPPRSLRRRWRLCSSAAPRIVIADVRPRENLARRKYDLMSFSSSFVCFFFFSHATFVFFHYLDVIDNRMPHFSISTRYCFTKCIKIKFWSIIKELVTNRYSWDVRLELIVLAPTQYNIIMLLNNYLSIWFILELNTLKIASIFSIPLLRKSYRRTLH